MGKGRAGDSPSSTTPAGEEHIRDLYRDPARITLPEARDAVRAMNEASVHFIDAFDSGAVDLERVNCALSAPAPRRWIPSGQFCLQN